MIATQAEQEEKMTQLLELNAKYESTIEELEEKTRKDNQQIQEMERAKCEMATELDDLKQQKEDNNSGLLSGTPYVENLWSANRQLALSGIKGNARANKFDGEDAAMYHGWKKALGWR